jgi:hypothetical protein
VTGRADLTDAQWAVLEPLLPKGKKPGRPPEWTKRQLINGDPVAGSGGRTVAGCATSLWILAGGVWAVPSLAAGRGVGGDPGWIAGSC